MAKQYTTEFYTKFASDCVHFLNELIKNRGFPYISKNGEFELKDFINKNYAKNLKSLDKYMDSFIFEKFMMFADELREKKRFADLTSEEESNLVKEILKSTKCLHED